MSHPFQVGKRYRNRVGEYVVESIDGDQMTVRYARGGVLETSVRLQTRIWENIQFEDQMAREEERRRLAREERAAARKRARLEKLIPKFGGFQPSDFEFKKRGIAWSSRKDLGKVLAYELSQGTGERFDNWVVPRQSAVQVARIDLFEKDHRDRNAAFFVAADEEGARFGLHVGKPAGDEKADWPWPLFVSMLADDNPVRRALRTVMRTQELTLDVYAMKARYGLVGQVTVETRGFMWRQETANQEVTKKMGWPDLEELIYTLAPGKRCELHLTKRLSVHAVLEAGDDIAQQMLPLFEELMPVYDTCVGV